MKTCRTCKTRFEASRPFQTWCSTACGTVQASQKLAKWHAKKAAAERKETREKLERLKPRKDWLAEAKVAVQRWRRLEEISKGSGCISCGRSQEEVQQAEGWKRGGAWDGGHFLSKGAYPELALEPRNIWLQCKSCNAGAGKYPHKARTVSQAFEANLRAREGDALVDWLKGPHEPAKWTIEELKAMTKEARAKTRELGR